MSMDKPNMSSDADQAQIISSIQKDFLYQSVQQQHLFDALQGVLGNRSIQRFSREIQSISDFMYLLTTNILNQKTLGEEYCGILKSTRTSDRICSRKRRFIYSLLLSFGPLFYEKWHFIVQKLKEARRNSGKVFSSRNTGGQIHEQIGRLQIVKKMPVSSSGKRIDPDQTKFKYPLILDPLLNFIKKFSKFWIGFCKYKSGKRMAAEWLIPIYMAAFYWNGKNYSIWQMISGIRFVKSNAPNSTAETADSKSFVNLEFKFFGLLLFLKTAIIFFSDLAKYRSADSSGLDSSDIPYMKAEKKNCILCLETWKDPSLTPCGHVFCWTCIIEYSQSQLKCPLCRTPLKPTSIYPIAI